MPHVTPEIGLPTLAFCSDGQRPIGEIDGWPVGTRREKSGNSGTQSERDESVTGRIGGGTVTRSRIQQLVCVSGLVLAGCQGQVPNTGLVAMSGSERMIVVSKNQPPVVNLRGVVQLPASLIAQGGGNLISQGGGNLIGQTASTYRLLDANRVVDPVMDVFLADGSGRVIAGLPIVRGDRAGRFVIPRVPAMLVYQLMARVSLQDGQRVELQSLVQPKVGSQGVEISPATTLVTEAILNSNGQKLASYDDALFQRAKRLVVEQLQAESSVDWTRRDAVSTLRENVLANVPVLKTLVTDVAQQITTAPTQREERVQQLVIDAIVQALPPNVRETIIADDVQLKVSTTEQGQVQLIGLNSKTGVQTELNATVETNAETGSGTTQTVVKRKNPQSGVDTTAQAVTITATDTQTQRTTTTTVDGQTGQTIKVDTDLTTGVSTETIAEPNPASPSITLSPPAKEPGLPLTKETTTRQSLPSPPAKEPGLPLTKETTTPQSLPSPPAKESGLPLRRETTTPLVVPSPPARISASPLKKEII